MAQDYLKFIAIKLVDSDQCAKVEKVTKRLFKVVFDKIPESKFNVGMAMIHMPGVDVLADPVVKWHLQFVLNDRIPTPPCEINRDSFLKRYRKIYNNYCICYYVSIPL